MCKNPYIKDTMPYGCGQCLPCRINKRRLWVHRIMLETLTNDRSCFVGLTYAPENEPPGRSLKPKDTQDWIKRLRFALGNRKIRYYLVGEYGDESQRPHYHAAIFGMSCITPLNCKAAMGFKRYERLCTDCSILQKSWGLGIIDVGDLNSHSAAYICGYVTKKMTNPKNEDVKKWLNGRHPEFARMSLKPGIGALAINIIAETLETDFGCNNLSDSGDVPQILQHGSRKFPLGKYLRGKLRERMGMEKTTPPEILQILKDEMHTLYIEYRKGKKAQALSQKQWLLEKNRQKVRNLEARTKLYKGIKKL